MRTVPLVVDGDVVINDSCAALRYLTATRDVEDHWYPKVTIPILQNSARLSSLQATYSCYNTRMKRVIPATLSMISDYCCPFFAHSHNISDIA